MAKTTDFLSQTRGKLDSMFQTRQTDHGTILARNPRRTGRRSEKQANMRCQMPNAAANYSLFHPMLNDAFEGKTAGQNDYNIFIQVNYGKNPIFITKQDSSCGGCVLGNYQYSRGSLNPIAITLGGNGVLSTGLGLGSLVIGAQTTVAELSAALIANNKDWVVDDQLTFFYGEQYVDSEGVPRATMEAFRMVLSMDDATPVWNMVPALGFSSVQTGSSGSSGSSYVLGMNAALQNAGASWIHSRNLSDGGTQVSTQRMKVVSDLMADYQGEEAMLASAASYGGINSKKVFLNPMSTLADVSAAINQNENENQNGSSGSSGSSSGSGSQSGSGSGSGSGTQQGGGSGSGTGGGSDPSTGSGQGTVAAPTFSGATQFTETTQVTMSGPAGAEIHYTLDGSIPTAESALYEGPITLSETTVVKAIAVKDGVSSSVTSRNYTKGSNTGGGDGEN